MVIQKNSLPVDKVKLIQKLFPHAIRRWFCIEFGHIGEEDLVEGVNPAMTDKEVKNRLRERLNSKMEEIVREEILKSMTEQLRLTKAELDYTLTLLFTILGGMEKGGPFTFLDRTCEWYIDEVLLPLIRKHPGIGQSH